MNASCVRSHRPKLVLVSPSMTEIREIISCRSMAFPEQRKAYMLRYIMRLSWEKIAEHTQRQRRRRRDTETRRRTDTGTHTRTGADAYTQTLRDRDAETRRNEDAETQRHEDADTHTQLHAR